MATHSRQHKHRQTSRTWTFVNAILLLLFTVLAVTTLFFMYKYNFLAFRKINVIYTVVMALVFIVSLILIVCRKGKVLTSVLLTLFTIVSAVTLFAFRSVVGVAHNMNKTASYSEIEMSVVVPTSSSISDISELTSVQAPTDADSGNIEALMSQINKDKGITLATENVESYQKAYENLIDGRSQAMVMNSAYSSLLELSYDNYESNLKTIYTYTLKSDVSREKHASADSNVFNIYVSGIDTYGSISTVSRSDVNIILTVNMNTHKILLTTTPRDAYVQIPDGGANQYDKLTHAGIYGVETSEKTLENLYGIDIDYYARINFTSFANLIDALGGIEVYNDQAFTSLHGDYDFPAGNITLDTGEKALGFVRERYSLEGGDNDRGKNQEKVIVAIINKLASFNSVSNISDIISTVQGSVQTDMSLDTMMSIANAQLDSGSKFTVTSQAVTGTGSTGQLTSYAMPTASLYMMQLDDSSVASATQAINDVMEGK